MKSPQFPIRFNIIPHFSLLFTYLLTYLHIPWSRILLARLTGFQPLKKFPAFYGTRMFITAFTSARHLSLSWARSIQSIPLHPTSCRSILILFPIYAWVFQVVSCPQVSPPKPSLHTCYMPLPFHSYRFDHPNNIGQGVQTIKLLIIYLSPLPFCCILCQGYPKRSLNTQPTVLVVLTVARNLCI